MALLQLWWCLGVMVVMHGWNRVHTIEHSWDVFTRESVGGVTDQEAGLTDSSISDNDALDGLHDARVVLGGVLVFVEEYE
jgi:hypothetical protein